MARDAIEDRLKTALCEAEVVGQSLGVLVLDLDHFQALNDQYGREAGNRVLRLVAQTLDAGLRRGDVAGRLGGQEFLAVLTNTGPRGAWLVAERLRTGLASLRADGLRAPSASVGVACFPQHGRSRGELMRSALSAMYDAKRLGRDRSVLFDAAAAEARSACAALAQSGHEDCLRSVLALAEAVDAHDASTQTHARSVADHAALIAGQLGLSGDRVEEVRLAGLLHDVGKIGVSDAILRKPGVLDELELAEMRRHPEIGARILAHPGLSRIREWVLHHHERPDGRGYPDGLRATRIPQEAMIIAVADAYAAMTADRPYRRALSPEAARAELRKGSGSQFDPAAVDAFIAALA